MSNYEIIQNQLCHILDEGKMNFIIFPFGENGMLTKQILNTAFGITEKYIVDNGLCKYNTAIKDSNFLKEFTNWETHKVLFCSYNLNLLKLLKEWVPEEHVIDIFGAVRPKNVGRYSYGPLAEYNSRIESVGAFCSFAIGSDAVWNHQLNMVTNHDFIYENAICGEVTNQKVNYEELNKKFVIGNDVWCGRNVILTNGIKVGNGARIGAGAIVTRDIPDYAIAVGVPAKIVGYRFSEQQIEKLNKIAWWDWPIEKINKCYDDFLNIDTFLQKHYQE